MGRPTHATEWLLTNGLGGSASGTSLGLPARRTHSLLTAAGPFGRTTALLLRVDEHLQIEQDLFDVSIALADPAAQAPVILEQFSFDLGPRWRLRVGGVLLEKSLFLIHGHHASVLTYRQLEGPAARLRVTPWIVARDPHRLQEEEPDLGIEIQGRPGRVRIDTRADRPPLVLWHNAAFLPARIWRRDLRYAAEGDATESALAPGHVEAGLQPGTALHVVASPDEGLFRALAAEGRLGAPPPQSLAECVLALENDLRQRVTALQGRLADGADETARQAAAAHGGAETALRQPRLIVPDDPVVRPLARVLGDALILRGSRPTLVTSLPSGLERGTAVLRIIPAVIALRAFRTAADVLTSCAEHVHEGIAPESFDLDDGTARYAGPEASLWLVHGAELLARRSENIDLVKETLLPSLDGLMQGLRSGTTSGVGLDSEGLLQVGPGEEAVRPAVLNALWSHALVAMGQLSRRVGRKESGAFYLAWAREHRARFLERFWDKRHGCLYDSIGPRGPVSGVSPAQLLAVTLAPSLLPDDRCLRLVTTLERRLFTPRGLRLAPDSSRVDSSWLGAFYSGSLRVYGRSAEAQTKVRKWFDETFDVLGFGMGAHLLDRAHEGPLIGSGGSRSGGSASRRRGRAGDAPENGPSDFDTLDVVTAAELLRTWIEEVDHAATPVEV